MDPITASYIDRATPDPNPLVMENVATFYMPQAPEYLDQVFRGIDWPEGTQYLGIEPAMPYESAIALLKKRDLTIPKTTLYHVKAKFLVDGKEETAFILLPYLERGGLMYLSGASYLVSPVLVEDPITISNSTVFIRLLRTKVKIIPVRTMIDNVTDDVSVPTTRLEMNSYVNRKTSKTKTSYRGKSINVTTNASMSLGHYLFAYYGVKETFKKFTGTDIVIGYPEEVNVEKYPPDEWVIYRSHGENPKKVSPYAYKDGVYEPSRICVAVPRQHDSDGLRVLLASLFHILDHWPARTTPKDLNSDKSSRLMRIRMGEIFYSGELDISTLMMEANMHIEGMEKFIDEIVMKKIHAQGYKVTNFFELLGEIAMRYTQTVEDERSLMRRKRSLSLDVLYFTLSVITSLVFDHIFKTKRNGPGNKNTLGGITTKLNRGVIIKFSKTVHTHINNISYPADDIYAGYGAPVYDQENIVLVTNSTSTGASSVRKVIEPITAEAAAIGSLLNLSKTDNGHNPLTKLNPYVEFDLSTGKIEIKNEKIKEIIKKTEELLNL